jgi:hypothetical protein
LDLLKEEQEAVVVAIIVPRIGNVANAITRRVKEEVLALEPASPVEKQASSNKSQKSEGLRVTRQHLTGDHDGGVRASDTVVDAHAQTRNGVPDLKERRGASFHLVNVPLLSRLVAITGHNERGGSIKDAFQTITRAIARGEEGSTSLSLATLATTAGFALRLVRSQMATMLVDL